MVVLPGELQLTLPFATEAIDESEEDQPTSGIGCWLPSLKVANGLKLYARSRGAREA
jgi:hypothetical protein